MKTRKISKQSLVIAVLSLLLVLSMGLYATGAYFTDKATTTGTNRTLTFGTVAVNATYAETGSSKTSYQGYMVPGDVIDLSGTVTPTSTVETYLLVRLVFTVKISADGTNWTDVGNLYTTTGTNENPQSSGAVLTISAPAWKVGTGEGAAAAFTTNYVAQSPDGIVANDYLYKVAVGVSAADLAANITLAPTCPNVVYAHKSSTPIYLNIGEGNSSADGVPALQNSGTAYQIQIVSSLSVASIQSKSAEVDLGATTAYGLLKDMLDA